MLCVNAMAAADPDAWKGDFLPSRVVVDEDANISEDGRGIGYGVRVSSLDDID